MSGPHTLFNESYQCSEAITAHRFVVQSGDQKVEMADAAGERVLGVALEDISTDDATAGAATAVAVEGSVYVEAGAAVTRGAQVTTDNQGRAVAAATGNTPVGFARKAAAAAGDLIPVHLTPGAPALP